jgi:hypothetical protein
MKRYFYKGWQIHRDHIGSQNWRASRSGVEICNSTYSGLLQMIDQREIDAHAWPYVPINKFA